MTTETFSSTRLKTIIDLASPQTTVFSDGSTFDYDNGYISNGAVATRDRVAPTIVKSHRVLTAGRVAGIILAVIAILLAAFFTLAIMSITQYNLNMDAMKAGINESGQVEVIETTGDDDVIVKDASSGSKFKCDIELVSNSGNPEGLAFCNPAGNPATFTIELPHDPNNVFYSAPSHD